MPTVEERYKVSSLLQYVCNVCAVLRPTASGDLRPHVDGIFNGIKVSCLLDSGANISIVSEQFFNLIPNAQSLPSFPVPAGMSVSAATGNTLTVVGNFQFQFRFLGRDFTRPFFGSGWTS